MYISDHLTFPAVESFLRRLKEVPPPPPLPPAEAESQRGGTMRRSAAAAALAAETPAADSLTSMSMALSAGPRASMLVRLLLRPCRGQRGRGAWSDE